MGKPGRNGAPSSVNPGDPPPGGRCVFEGPPLGPGGEDITWPNQVAPRGQKASSTRKIKPQTSNLAETFLQKEIFAKTGETDCESLFNLGRSPPKVGEDIPSL